MHVHIVYLGLQNTNIIPFGDISHYTVVFHSSYIMFSPIRKKMIVALTTKSWKIPVCCPDVFGMICNSSDYAHTLHSVSLDYKAKWASALSRVGMEKAAKQDFQPKNQCGWCQQLSRKWACWHQHAYIFTTAMLLQLYLAGILFVRLPILSQHVCMWLISTKLYQTSWCLRIKSAGSWKR